MEGGLWQKLCNISVIHRPIKKLLSYVDLDCYRKWPLTLTFQLNMKLEPESTHASCIMQYIVQRPRYNWWKHHAETGQKQYVPWYLISKTCTWLRILHYAVAILLYSARLRKPLAMHVCSYISWRSASHRYTCICLRKLNFKQYNTLDYIPWWF